MDFIVPLNARQLDPISVKPHPMARGVAVRSREQKPRREIGEFIPFGRTS